MYDAESNSNSAVRCQSILFVIIGLFLIVGGSQSSLDTFYIFFDLGGGFLALTTGILGLLATHDSRFISCFIAMLYIYATSLAIVYAGGLLAVMFLAIFFQTCGENSGSSCHNNEAIQIVVMIIYMVIDFGLFCLLTLATYAIRDARRLKSFN